MIIEGDGLNTQHTRDARAHVNMSRSAWHVLEHHGTQHKTRVFPISQHNTLVLPEFTTHNNKWFRVRYHILIF